MESLYVLMYVDETGEPIEVVKTGKYQTPAVYDKLSSAKAIRTNNNRRYKQKMDIFEISLIKKVLTTP